MSKRHHTSEVARLAPAIRKTAESQDIVAQDRSRHGGVTFEEAVRARAYQNWELAGHPPGDGIPFWLAAEEELSVYR